MVTSQSRMFGWLMIVALVTGGQWLAARQDSDAAQAGLESPTAVLHRMRAAIAAGPREKQGDIAKPLLEMARKTELSAHEEVALGELYFLSLMGGPADRIFVKYLDRRDALGRMSWLRHQQILFRAREAFDEVERNIPEFRRRFSPSAEDLTYTSGMVGNLAARLADQGHHDKAVALILGDVEPLPKNLPLRSFRLLGTRYQSFVAIGKGSEARAILQAHRSALQSRIDAEGRGVVAASQLPGEPLKHRDGHVHMDFDIGLLDDAPGFSAERFATQLAIDRVKEIDGFLKQMRD